jgi:hypothetical protein
MLLEERRTMKPVPELSRRKSHWDYVLEEMKWMANDFWQVRGVRLLSGTGITGVGLLVVPGDRS